MSLDAALSQLSRLPADERLAAILALEEKRKKEHFARYWQATPAQQEAIAQFTPELKVFGLLGGNRSGKTELGAFLTTAAFLGKSYFKDEPSWDLVKDVPLPDENKPRIIWATGLDYNIVRDVILQEKLLTGRNHPGLIPKLDESVIAKVSEYESRIIHADGSILQCKSAEAGREKFQAASVDWAWIDEEPNKDIYDEIFQRTIDCNGKILITLTPLNDINSAAREPWVFDLHQEWKAGRKDVRFVSLSVLDNPHIPEDEKERLKARWLNGDPEGRARIYGEFISRAGLVFKAFNRNTHLVKRFTIPKEWYRLNVIDPAPTGPTGSCSIAFAPNGDAYLDLEYKERDLIVSEHAKNLSTLYSGNVIDLWLIDPRGGNQKNAESHRTCKDLYAMSGINCRFPQFDEQYGRDIFNEYLNATTDSNARHPKFFAFDDNHKFVDEIETYTYDFHARGRLKGLSKDRPAKGNDDILQCIGMALGYMNGRKPHLRSREFRGGIVKHNAQHNSYF